MEEKQVSLSVLIIVLSVALIAIFALFSTLHIGVSLDLTGAAVKGQIAVLCKDTDGSNPEKNGIVNIFYGSRFPDQCYNDKEAKEDPTNNGQFLREYKCENNEVTFDVYECSKNKCQYGVCVGSSSTLL